MRKTPVKILLLTADAGFGHRSAANAVEEALKIQYGTDVETNIINPLDHKKTPAFLRDSQTDYDRWIKEVPELYKFGYEASESRITTSMLENSLAMLLYEVIKDIFNEYKPDAVLSTYPMYQAPIFRFFKTKKSHIPVYVVITDLSTVHRLWFNKKVDGCLVPNQIVADMAINYHIPAEKVIITGIPVYPDISRETRTQDEIRQELGWQLQIPTLLTVASKRTENVLEMVNVVNHYGAPLQLAVVAGNNDELYANLENVDWHITVHLYNFVKDMPVLMKASDLIISKAGGLIVTEALACGLPMLLTEIIPGQETGNAEYVRDVQAGFVVNSPIEMLEALHHLMKDDRTLLKEFAANACASGKPESAFKAASIIWQAAVTRVDSKLAQRTRNSSFIAESDS